MQSMVNEISFGQGSLQKAPSSATAPKCERPSDVVRKHPDPQLPVRDFKPCRALSSPATLRFSSALFGGRRPRELANFERTRSYGQSVIEGTSV